DVGLAPLLPTGPRHGAASASAIAVEHHRPLVVRQYGQLSRIVVIVQIRTVEAEMTQDTAEGALEIGLGECRRCRAGGEHGAVEQHDVVAEIRHTAEV